MVSIFCFWVIFRNGAEVLEGWLAALAMDLFAGMLTVKYLKAYAGIIWLVWLASLVRRQVAVQAI